MNCRINRRRQWTARLMMELKTHLTASFVTLTYRPEDVPVAVCDGMVQQVLNPKHMTAFLKAMAYILGTSPRYFYVGEYGSQTQRPHYHALLFGLDPLRQDLIERAWKYGFVSSYEVNEKRCAYVAHYTTKKWLQKSTPALAGRPPEFARMSRKPGIGVPFLPAVVASMQTRTGSAAIANGELPNVARIEGKQYPLDRFMMEKMREGLGLPPKFGKQLPGPATEETREDVQEKKQALRRAENSHQILRRQAQAHGSL